MNCAKFIPQPRNQRLRNLRPVCFLPTSLPISPMDPWLFLFLCAGRGAPADGCECAHLSRCAGIRFLLFFRKEKKKLSKKKRNGLPAPQFLFQFLSYGSPDSSLAQLQPLVSSMAAWHEPQSSHESHSFEVVAGIA